MTIRDEDGHPLKTGDHISFAFGIPPTSVLCRLNTEVGELWVNVLHPEDVTPKREKLSSLMTWYQVWKASPARVAAYHRDYRPAGSTDPARLAQGRGDAKRGEG
jgi:hypothetical protein